MPALGARGDQPGLRYIRSRFTYRRRLFRGTARYRSINRAIAAVPRGGTVIVYLHNNHYGIYLNGRIHAVIRPNRFHRVRVHIKVA